MWAHPGHRGSQVGVPDRAHWGLIGQASRGTPEPVGNPYYERDRARSNTTVPTVPHCNSVGHMGTPVVGTVPIRHGHTMGTWAHLLGIR